jgi:hypothetical protein
MSKMKPQIKTTRPVSSPKLADKYFLDDQPYKSKAA